MTLLSPVLLKSGIASVKGATVLAALIYPGLMSGTATVKCYGNLPVTTSTGTTQKQALLFEGIIGSGQVINLNIPAQNIWCQTDRTLDPPVEIIGGNQ